MNTRHRLRAKLIPCWLALALATAGAQAATDHAAHTQAPAQLELNQGKKWPTDAPLRQGMQNIRTIMQAAVRNIHAGKVSASQYNDIARRTSAELGHVVANCKLAPQADAQLHHIITGMLHGADVMEGKVKGTSRQAGAASVLQALEDYAVYFDHPGWKPVEH